MLTEPRLLIVTALFALVLGACGGDDDTADAPPDDTTETEDVETEDVETDPLADDPTEPGEEETDAAPADDTTVATATLDLGDVLVDDDGMTLYMFDPDEQGPSTCYDDCEANWPPLVTDGEPVAGDGVDAGLLGTAERDDGSQQVTYDGWPLYHWIGDEAEGDTAGQGVQDVWWVMEPDGTPIRDDAGDASNDGPSY